MKRSELKYMIKELLKEEIGALPGDPKKNIDKVSDIIVSIRHVQQQVFEKKPKVAELLGQAADLLEKAQNSL